MLDALCRAGRPRRADSRPDAAPPLPTRTTTAATRLTTSSPSSCTGPIRDARVRTSNSLPPSSGRWPGCVLGDARSIPAGVVRGSQGAIDYCSCTRWRRGRGAARRHSRSADKVRGRRRRPDRSTVCVLVVLMKGAKLLAAPLASGLSISRAASRQVIHAPPPISPCEEPPVK